MKRPSAILVGIGLFVLLSCPSRWAFSAVKPIGVFVSIPPQADFVDRIGGHRVEVHVLVGPGQSPHSFEPTPKQLADLATAKLYFAIGLPFEKRLLAKVRSAHPDIRIVHTERGVPYRLLRGMLAGHGHDERQPESVNRMGHVHGQGPMGIGLLPDPHIWLAPKLVKLQAKTIAEALRELDPGGLSEYVDNLKAFLADLDRIDAKIAHELAPYRGRAFYTVHPAFGYFANAYGLRQVSIEHEGKAPGAEALAAMIAGAKARDAKVIFVEPQFSKRQAEAIATAIGGRVETLDPLAKNYLDNLQVIADRIRNAVSTER